MRILRTRRIQTVIATLSRTLYERLLRLGILEQILLHVAAHLLIVRLMEKGTVQVINVPADILHAYTPLTSLSENFQYLLVVTHYLLFHIKKGRYAV